MCGHGSLGILLTSVIKLYGTSGNVFAISTNADVHQSAPAADVFAIRQTISPYFASFLSLSADIFLPPFYCLSNFMALMINITITPHAALIAAVIA